MTDLKFLHFPVAAKAVLLIAALGLLSIAANWFCLERLDEIDRLNATVTAIWRPPAWHSPRPRRRANHSVPQFTKVIRPPIRIK